MGELITFPSNGKTCSGYLAVPEKGSGPGLIVIQEWWGLVPHIKDVADRLAAAGYVALAPDVYHGQETTEPDEAGKLMMALALETTARDMSAAVDHLAGLSMTVGKGIGVIGFCMGGVWPSGCRPSTARSRLASPSMAPFPGRTSNPTTPIRWQPIWGIMPNTTAGRLSTRPGTSNANYANSAGRSSSMSIPTPSTRSSTTAGPRCTTPRRPSWRGRERSPSYEAVSVERYLS